MGGCQCFADGHGGQNGGKAFGEHGFAGSGRSDHDDVVPTGSGYFEGAFGGFLSADFRKVGETLLIFHEEGLEFGLNGFENGGAVLVCLPVEKKNEYKIFIQI